jgi:hypothetical protein
MHAVVCNRNGIKIYYSAIDNFSGKIVIDDNGKLRIGSQKYKGQHARAKFTKTDKLWWKVVEQLYTQEYNKLPEDRKVFEPVMIEFEILATLLNGKTMKVV